MSDEPRTGTSGRLRGKGTELVLLAGLIALIIAVAITWGVDAGTIFASGTAAGVWAMLILNVRDEQRERDRG